MAGFVALLVCPKPELLRLDRASSSAPSSATSGTSHDSTLSNLDAVHYSTNHIVILIPEIVPRFPAWLTRYRFPFPRVNW
jgi:hypothetical protein